MVLTRSQYKNMKKEELIHGLTDINYSFVNDINAKLTDLSERFNKFTSKYEKSILSCSNVKASTLIYLPGSFSWSVTLLLILNIVEERLFN